MIKEQSTERPVPATPLDSEAALDARDTAVSVRHRDPPDSDAHFDATRMYLSEIGFSPLLSAEEEVYYARLAQKGDESGRRRMIESNLRLVVKIARRYVNRGLALLDLEDPCRVIARSDQWAFSPEESYEVFGDVNKVVFPCGWLVNGDTVRLYYGGADTCMALATASLSGLLSWLREHKG